MITISTYKPIINAWTAYRICKPSFRLPSAYKEAVFGNEFEHGFTSDFLGRTHIALHSKTDLERRIKGLGLGEYLQLINIRVLESYADNMDYYNMNWFIDDVILNDMDRIRSGGL